MLATCSPLMISAAPGSVLPIDFHNVAVQLGIFHFERHLLLFPLDDKRDLERIVNSLVLLSASIARTRQK